MRRGRWNLVRSHFIGARRLAAASLRRGRSPLSFGMSSRGLSGAVAVLTRRRAKRNVDGMWRIVRTLLFALALAGSIGQASAFAAPQRPGVTADAMAGMPDCAEMMIQAGAQGPAPCDDSGPRCLGLAACAAVAVPLSSDAGVTARPSAPHRQQVALSADDTRAGERPTPLGDPPKTPA